MKTFFSILLISSFCSAAPIKTSVDQSMEMKVNKGEVEITLPAEAKKALIQWNPEFIPFDLKNYSPIIMAMFKDADANSAPMAFIADLDSDGEKDIVLLGADLSRQYAVALVQKNKTWQAIEVHSWSIPDVKSASIMNPTNSKAKAENGIPIYIFPAIGEHAKKLGKKIGIQTELYLGPAQVYEIKNGKAEQLILK